MVIDGVMVRRKHPLLLVTAATHEILIFDFKKRKSNEERKIQFSLENILN